jgi:hypothetical protein
MWHIRGLQYPQKGDHARELPLQSIDNASVAGGYNKCNAVEQPKEICASNKVLGETTIAQKTEPASSSRVPCRQLARENVRTSTKAPLSNTENNRDLVQALSWSITLYKSNTRLSNNSLRDSLLSDSHSRDKFTAFFSSTQTLLTRKPHLPPTQSQHQHSTNSEPQILASQDFSDLEKPLPCHQNPQKHVAQRHNSNSPECQKTILHPDRESAFHSGHISGRVSSPTRLSPLQESQSKSIHLDSNESQDLRKYIPPHQHELTHT